MAANYTDKEREERIILVGDYFMETGASTRQIAEYFSNNFFKISNATVCDYIKKYKKLKNLDREIEKKIKENSPETISDKNVAKRVLKFAQLYLKDNKTIEEIADETKTEYWTVYRDLTDRLKQLDSEVFEAVSEKMSQKKHEPKDRKKK